MAILLKNKYPIGMTLMLKAIGLAGMFFFISCSTIDIHVQESIAHNNQTLRVAILPFKINGEDFGNEFADSIGLYLAKKPWFVQVERGPELMRILNEQGFSQTGLIDTDTRLKIGKMTSANLIIAGQGTALNYKDQEGKQHRHLVDTFSLKAIDVITGKHVITIRKKPGRAWTWPGRLKWMLSLSLIWDLEDILIESSEYDELAQQIADKIESSIISGKEEKLRTDTLNGAPQQ